LEGALIALTAADCLVFSFEVMAESIHHRQGTKPPFSLPAALL